MQDLVIFTYPTNTFFISSIPNSSTPTLTFRHPVIALLASLQASSFGHLASAEPEINTMDTLETTVQREESTEDTQESHPTSETDHAFLTIFPRGLRDIVYDLMLRHHTIHIKSDMIPQRFNSEVDKQDDEDDEYNDDDNDWYHGDDEERPTEYSEMLDEHRGPLYHRICDNELLHPKEAQLYRIRSLEANSSSDSRVQSNMIVEDFEHVQHPKRPDPNLEHETMRSLEEEDKPPAQIKLAFLRANKQIYDEASTRLYTTRTFSFSDPTTFAQFFSINHSYNADPPTPTNGTTLLATKRNSITSVHLRARTALYLMPKIQWMAVLDAAPFALPRLQKMRVLFDLCHGGKEGHVDGTRWQYSRHRNRLPLLKTAEVRVARHRLRFLKEVKDDAKSDRNYAVREVGWRVELLEAIVGHHMDVLFGASLLDPASVAERNAVFDQECS